MMTPGRQPVMNQRCHLPAKNVEDLQFHLRSRWEREADFCCRIAGGSVCGEWIRIILLQNKFTRNRQQPFRHADSGVKIVIEKDLRDIRKTLRFGNAGAGVGAAADDVCHDDINGLILYELERSHILHLAHIPGN